MDKTRARQPKRYKVINTYLDLPPEEKQAAWEKKRRELYEVLLRRHEAGTLFKK